MGLLARVDEHVLGEGTTLIKRFAAHGTHMRVLACVDDQVPCEVTQPRK